MIRGSLARSERGKVVRSQDRVSQDGLIEITPAVIIEQCVDELAMGDLGLAVESFTITRLGPASLLLDYGASGRFKLTVEIAS